MAWPDDVTKADLRIEFYRGSGAGGQHRNKTDSAVRMTHLPTGLSATAEDQRKQGQNKKMAFRRLAAKLIPLMKAELAKRQVPEIDTTRRVRTYNEKRGTVVDHRVPERAFSYSKVLDGELTPVIVAVSEQKAKEEEE